MYEENINLEDLDTDETCYADTAPLMEDSAIIRCGRYLSVKARKNAVQALAGGTGSDVAVIADDLLPEQKQYIDLVATGTPSITACQMLGLDIFLPTLWEETVDKDGTYMQCMLLLKRKQADLLEENVWDIAMNNPKSALLKMFALKARKDEYKDNAAPMTNVQTNIQVTISDQQGNVIPYTVDTSPNIVEDINRG